MTRAYNTATTQQNSGGAVNPFAAGKNKIINGDFGVWQRGTSFTTAPNYCADRWWFNYNGTGTVVTISQQTFTPGTAPVAGYESQYFLRYNCTTAGTGNNTHMVEQRIEDVRTLAGQTITVSFWAKADSTRTISQVIRQNFGSGGSAEVYTNGSTITLSTSWTRYTQVFTLPSISGKTIGSGNYLGFYFAMVNGVTMTIDYWGVQIEAGSVATPFQTATGTIQGELAACQRYFQKSFQLSTAPANNSNDPLGAVTFGRQATSGAVEPQIWIQWKTQMRSAPSVTLYNLYSGTAGQWSDGTTTGANARCFNISDTAAVIDNTDVTLTLANAVIHYAASSEL